MKPSYYVRPSNQRWNQDALWKNPIHSNNRLRIVVDVTGALIGAALIGHFAYEALTTGEAGPAKLFEQGVMLALAIGGSIYGYQTAQNIYHYLSFGEAPLTLDYFPALLGDTLLGNIAFKKRLPTTQVQLHLTCSRKHQRPPKGTRRDQRLWEAKANVLLLQKEQGSSIPINIDLPSGLPESKSGEVEHVEWVLTVSIAGSPHFHREYYLPVYEGRRWERSSASE